MATGAGADETGPYVCGGVGPAVDKLLRTTTCRFIIDGLQLRLRNVSSLREATSQPECCRSKPRGPF